MHYNKTQRFFFHGSCNVIHDTMNVHTMYMCIFNWNVVFACTPWLSYINTSTLYLSMIALHSPISVILSYSVWIDLAKMLFIFSKPYKKYCFNVCFMMMLCIVWTSDDFPLNLPTSSTVMESCVMTLNGGSFLL